MPTFPLSDEETFKLVRYFAAQDGIDNPFVHIDQARLSPEYVAAGEMLASADYFSCWTCHQQGDRKPEGPQEGWAPDLGLANVRLNPDWIVAWIRDPQALMPGTRMPSFYDFSNDDRDGPEDVLETDHQQVEALRDYLLTLDAATAAPVVVAPASEPPPVAGDSEDAAAPAEGIGAVVQIEG